MKRVNSSPAEVPFISANEQQLNLLMVDDAPADGEMVRRYLEDETIPWATELELARSLDEALSHVAEKRVDVLIIDYRFPFGNGFDVLERLRQEGLDAPALMLTGEGDESVAARAVKHQLQDYLPKGDLAPETLKESLETILSGTPPGSTPAAGAGNSTDRIELGGLQEFLPKISGKLRNSEDFRVLFLRTSIGNLEEPLDLKSILEATFREVALEPLTFYRVHGDVVMALLAEPLERIFSLEEPRANLLDELREVLDGLQPGTRGAGMSTVGGVLAKIEGFERDPAALVNHVLDELRHETEEEGERLETVTISGQP